MKDTAKVEKITVFGGKLQATGFLRKRRSEFYKNYGTSCSPSGQKREEETCYECGRHGHKLWEYP